MRPYNHAIRKPVRRPRVGTYLLLTLLSFALSVSLTRLFLALTGYPQLGNSVLHISHVLWGGLLLFLAAMLPLVLANRWVYWLSAIMAGVGIGLFIDEVGKFITQSYDYFFPPAAPIIYAFFLICVLAYLQIKRPGPRRSRTELYTVMELMEEVLDHDLDSREYEEIKKRLGYVIERDENPELTRLATDLVGYFDDDQIRLSPTRPGWGQKIPNRLVSIEKQYINQLRLRNFLIYGVGILGISSIVVSIVSMLEFSASTSSWSSPEILWFAALQAVHMISGTLLVYSAIQVRIGNESQGLRISYIILLVYLTMINLFLFYYYQFATIFVASLQFVLLLGVIRYRHLYTNDMKISPDEFS
jgi:hypothetical protein